MKVSVVATSLCVAAALTAPAAHCGQDSRGATLADRKGCYECHEVGRTVVGPGFTQIAARYRFDPGAKEKLTEIIRVGGRGHWGDRFNMWPHTDLTDNQARQLAEWVLEQ